ncbi:MAG: MG2 domain-containing protein [Verrucomicrobiota bacterium]
MKRLIPLFLLAVLSSPSPAQTPAESLAKVRRLSEQGNHREAADLGKATLVKPGAPAELLEATLQPLSNLSAHQEQEEVIEAAVKAHPKEWDMLRAAGLHYASYIPHYGEVVDGKFVRGQVRDWNSRKGTELKDRVRALQLLEAAWEALPAEAEVSFKALVIENLTLALMNQGRGAFNAWSLLALTDLTTLPDYDDQSGLDAPASGYPADEKSDPIFFQVPASWETAKNDGERLRWLQAERSKLSADETLKVRRELVEVATGWFSVQTLAGYGFRFDDKDDDAGTKSGIAMLHTLKDDETVAKLATGPKRFILPPEWSFLTLWKSIAEDAQAPVYSRKEAWERVAQELLNRRQHPRAVEALQKALELETDADGKKNLQAQIEQITGNWGHFEPQQSFPAGQEAKLQLVFRNAKKISLSARKVDVAKLLTDAEAYLRSEPREFDWQKANLNTIGQRLLDKGGDKYLGKPMAEWSQDLEPRANHWDKRVEVPTPLKDAGAFLVEGTFDGGHKARALIWLESTVIVRTSQSNGLHYFVADAATGAPVVGATVRFFGYRTQWGRGGLLNREKTLYSFKDIQATTDKNGVVKVKENLNEHQWLIRATTPDGRLAYDGFESAYFYDHSVRFGEQTRLYSITDRPVYRPGQEVKWKAWARLVGYDPKLNTNKFAGKSLRVRIYDPRGEEVSMKDYESDGSGAIHDMLSLADDATLGQYRLQFALKPALGHEEHLGQHVFRVEEYKKPEFEVKVEAPEKPVALGDTFEVKVKADYYFGGPVKQGKVKYKVQRSAHTDRWFPMGRWDWLFGAGYGWQATYYNWYPGSSRWCMCVPRWPWFRWQSDPPELVAEGEAPLNADGTFTVKVDTTLAKELHGDEDHRYEIDAEVTDQSRRTIFGKGSVLAARRPFEVYASTDRGYYNAGDSGTVNIHARTLDGREVKATGEVVLYRVTYGKDGAPVEEAVHTVRISLTSDKPAAQEKLTFAQGGQYRVSAKLKDEAGHEIEGTTFLTVRGQGFNEGRDFRFDDLELLTQKEEYASGEEVEVTLNTNRMGSTVALFLRAQNRVYPEPVWLKLEGKSITHRFKLDEADQPNLFIEAYTVSGARVHKVTRQIIVPPKKRIASVELIPDAETYLPGQGSKVKVRVKDVDGKPFTGQVVLTAYDKALEYISGGSNQQDIRPFFWGWKRSHYSQINDSLRRMEARLLREGELSMEFLGAFGNVTADEGVVDFLAGGASGGGGGFGRSRGEAKFAARSAPMAMAAADSFAGAPGSPPPPPSPAPAKAEAAGAPSEPSGGEEGPAPMIRTNLADSAVWVADFATDANGEGELNFNLPENLTTWKLRSWVMGPQTQVGEAAVEIITRKNLMVRLQAPRFFVEKDEVVISANVHNEMDVSQQVKAVLELEGGVLEFIEAETRTPAPVEVAAHGETRIDWRVKVTGEGEAKIRVKALAQKDSDAMEMTFPAYTHGMLKTDSWSLALRPNQASGKLTVKVPAERKPEQSRLELRYSPTLAMTLVDALPYLVDYPYGCTEQTLNRFVPTVITLNVLKDLGVDLKAVRDKRTNLNAQEIGDPDKRAKRWQGKDNKGKLKEPVFDEDEVMRMAKAGLKRLEAMRGSDGGWGWFPGGRESSPHITALVLHGLKAAERARMDLNDGIARSGVEYLNRHETEQLRRLRLPEKHKDHKSAPDDLDALIHSVLVEYKGGKKEMRAQLYEKRNGISRYNLCLLGLACHAVGENERRDMCLRNVRQFLKKDDENQTAWLELPQDGWWYWWDNAIETQAAFLRLLAAVEPKGETAPALAKYLLNNRRNGTYWNSTKDTAAVIEALAEFVKASGESAPQQTVELLVDGKSQTKVEITKENLFTFNGTFVLEGEALTTGEHSVELRKLGESPLYVNAYLTVFSKEDMIPAAGLEVKARRKFYKLIEEKPDQQVAGSRGQVVTQQGLKYRREEIASDAAIKSGDLIEVELSIESKNDYEYVLIEDMKPAGFEPVEVRSGWNYDGLASYQEYRDERVAFFADRLPKGTHNLRYRVKAEIPGRFSALPTKIEAMYAPELKGNSDEWKAKIVEE